MSALVLGLDPVSARMLARVGGKAANLGELLSAGLPVPDGFCLTTDAYLQAVAPLGLGQVHRALQATPSDDVDALAELAGHARALIISAELPPVMAEAVRSAYEELHTKGVPHVPVAMRSSATAEDLPLASFAGQQDAERTWSARRRCSMQCVTAGHHYGPTGRLQRRLGDKRILVRPLPGGGTERVDRRAEDHFGSPQDTEWVIDPAGKAWLTQSRPIATLYPLPEWGPSTGKVPAEESHRVFLCFSLAQGLTRPLTPMGLAAFRLFGSSAARVASFDLTAAARSSVGRWIVPKAFDVMEARSAAVLRSVFEDPRFSVTRRTPWALLPGA